MNEQMGALCLFILSVSVSLCLRKPLKINTFRSVVLKNKMAKSWNWMVHFFRDTNLCSKEKSSLILLNCLGKLIIISNVYGLLSKKINAKSSKM